MRCDFEGGGRGDRKVHRHIVDLSVAAGATTKKHSLTIDCNREEVSRIP